VLLKKNFEGGRGCDIRSGGKEFIYGFGDSRAFVS
jgi:hypothetical protein